MRADRQVQEAYLGEEVRVMAPARGRGPARPLRQEPHPARRLDSRIAPGEIVSLLGRNGSGRSTTLKAIMGLVPPTGGRGAPRRRRSRRRARLQDRPRRASPTCRRSARSSPTSRSTRTCASACSRRDAGVPTWTSSRCTTYFPQLKERRNTAAGMLSGGEQQMLTICRSLLGNPRVILIDEPTEGLAPKIVEVVTEVICDICRQGVSVLLVEQKLTIAMRVSQRVYVMGHGQIVFGGHARDAAQCPRRAAGLARGRLVGRQWSQ